MSSNHTAITNSAFFNKLWHNAWKYLLIAASLAATVKIIFFGFDIDEQYAVSMAYRMIRGDRMFLEMWEPHQTSAFFSAAFLWIYVHIFHSLNYAVIFLRFTGVFTQFMISIFLFRTFCKMFSRETAFVTAIFYYNLIPKNSTVPDFSNMLLWFSTLSFLCFLEFYMAEQNFRSKRSAFFLIAAGINSALLVLSYPSCIIIVIPWCIGLFLLSRSVNRFKNILYYLGTCGICAVCWLSYFLNHMSFSDFIYGLLQMSADGSHDVTIFEKIKAYFLLAFEVFPYFLVALAFALIIYYILKALLHKKYSLFLILIITLSVEQGYIWYSLQKHLAYPGILYFLLPLYGIYKYLTSGKSGKKQKPDMYTTIYWFGSIASFFLLLAAVIVSNTPLYESFGYMGIGMLASLCYLENERVTCCNFWRTVLFFLLGIVIIHKAFMLYNIYGHDTIFVTRQKAESGPMAGIYGRYSDGYDYNIRGRLLDEYIPRGSKVLIVSHKTIMYLQEGYDVCNYSTISTPTIDDRLFRYWSLYPDKVPEYIIWDKCSEGYIATNSDVNTKLVENAELLADDEGLCIYKLPINPY